MEHGPEININELRRRDQSTKGKIISLSRTAKIFIAIIILESAIIIGLTIQRMITPQNGDLSIKYSSLMLLNALLLLIFALDGVINENAFELLAFVFISITVTTFTTYQFWFAPEKTEKIILWIRFISVSIFTPLNVVFAYLVYSAFGWAMYRKIGASLSLAAAYKRYQIFLALLKLDLQFWFVCFSRLANPNLTA